MTSGHKVLVVDDEDAIRLTVKSMLEFSGYEILDAASGEAALELFRAEGSAIDVVLLDLSLPGIGGVEVLSELDSMGGDIPTIVSSGFDRETAFERLAPRKPAGFIQKPFRLKQLLAELERVLSA